MDYLQNVLMSWAGYATPWFILGVAVAALIYAFVTIARSSEDPEIQQARTRILAFRRTLVKLWLAVLLAMLVVSAVLPGNTPKNTVRTDPSAIERSQQIERLQRQGSQPMRVIAAPGPGWDSERELRQACREARQGYREMDMELCEGVN